MKRVLIIVRFRFFVEQCFFELLELVMKQLVAFLGALSDDAIDKAENDAKEGTDNNAAEGSDSEDGC